MGFTWDRRDFSQQLSKLQELINKETDIKRKLYLEKVLESFSNVSNKADNCASYARTTFS